MRRRIAVGSTAFGASSLLRLPNKAEGDSIKALLVKRVEFAIDSYTAPAAADFFSMQLGVSVPTRWGAAPTARALGGAAISAPRTFFWGAFGFFYIAAAPTWHVFSSLPQLAVGDDLTLQSTGYATGGLNLIMDIDYELVEISEFQFEQILAGQEVYF